MTLGPLPFKTELTIDVPDLNDSKPILLYYVNETTGRLELAGKAKVVDGTVTFILKHCSSYVIIDAPVLIDGYQTLAYVSGYDDGTFKPGKSLSRAEAAAMLDRLLESDGILDDADFTDTDMWAKASINNLVAIGVINGYSDDTYKPDNTITRGELAVLLTRMLALDNSDSSDYSVFTDISGHWAADAILALYDAGISKGYTDGSFRPDDPISRIEAVTMINRALGRAASSGTDHDKDSDIVEFVDVPKEHWGYLEAMNASGN